jgi:hypothetical protein
VQTQVQSYLEAHGLVERGLAQDLMLGFSSDPKEVQFLQPPAEAFVLQPVPVQPEVYPSAKQADKFEPYVDILIAESSTRRWPHVLLQLCRYSEAAMKMLQNDTVDSQTTEPLKQALFACDVVGEVWLKSPDDMFPETGIAGVRKDGSPAAQAVFRNGMFSSTHVLQCELKDAAVGARTHQYSYAANIPGHSSAGGNASFGQHSLPVHFGIASFNNTLHWLNRREEFDSREKSLAHRLGLDATDHSEAGLPNVGADTTSQQLLGQVNKGIASSFHGNVRAFMRCADVHGRGEVTQMEFEYACKRRLGIDLEDAGKAFTRCLQLTCRESEGTLSCSSLCSALQGASSGDAQTQSPAGTDCPVHLSADLAWSWGSADAASLHVRNLEISQATPLAPTDYVASGVSDANVGNRYRGRPTENWVKAHHGQSKLREHETPSVFFLRTCLCTSRDIASDVASTRSHFVPHVVHMSPTLWHGTRPDSGELYLRLPPDITSNGEQGPDATVPVCTMRQLCQIQRSALTAPMNLFSQCPPEYQQNHHSASKWQYPMQAPQAQNTRELQAELPWYARRPRTASDP